MDISVVRARTYSDLPFGIQLLATTASLPVKNFTELAHHAWIIGTWANMV